MAPGVSLEFHSAGHILGAAMAVFRSEHGSLAMSGDFAVTKQHTIPGCTDAQLDVDVFVTESTYGGRHHAPRAKEEQRLASQVSDVLNRGGNVLFPAFAIGRSQELLLILAREMQRGTVPEVPVYVDGLVRHVCGLYTQGLAPLSPWLQRRGHTSHPFWPEDGPIQPMWDVRNREQLALAPGPKVFVSSSGMLTGGPSALYARLFAAQTESFIAITGYQDEESPGRAVQNLAAQGGGLLQLPDGPVELRCKVGTYGLSAHADEGQVVDVAGQSGARHVVLVHGDRNARQQMSTALHRRYGDNVTTWRPGLHEELRLQTQPRTWAAVPTDGDADFTLEDVVLLAETRKHDPKPALLSELARALGLRGRRLQPERLQPLETLLLGDGSPWRRKKGRFTIAKMPDGTLLLRGNRRIKPKKAARRDLPEVRQGEVMEKLRELWDESCVPYRVSAHIASAHMVLRWSFPDVVAGRYDEALAVISDTVGWTFEHSKNPNHIHLDELVAQALPPHWKLLKSPSIFLADRRVTLLIDLPELEDWAVSETRELFERKTGFALKLKPHTPPAPQGKQAPSGQAPGEQAPSTSPPPTPGKGKAPAFVLAPATPPDVPMVTNHAVARAKTVLRKALGHDVKVKVQGQTMVIAFCTPQLGRRYEATLQQLADETGWRLGARQTPDQNALLDVARRYTHGWALRKPGLSVHADHLAVTVSEAPPQPVADAACDNVLKLTGWPLRIHLKPLV